MVRSLVVDRALTLLAALALLAAAPAPARADLAAGLSSPAPPAQGGAPNVSNLVTDGLAATGEIEDEDTLPAGTDFDNVTTGLETAAGEFDDSIGDGTSVAAPAAVGAAAAAAAACAVAFAL